MNWRNLSVGHEKYVRFSPTCDFSGFLGNKGMGRNVILDDAERGAPTQDLGVPTGSIVEVEEAIAVDENDVGTDSQRPRVKDEAEDVEMTDTGADTEAKFSPKRERTASPSPTPRKRRRSVNAKPNSTEETGVRTLNVLALTSRRTRSKVEVVVPPRNGDSPTKPKKPISHKLLVPESPISAKEKSPVKVRTSARKSVPANNRDEEEEPASTKRPQRKTQKRKRHESESEAEPEEPTPGPSKPKPARRSTQESSPVPARVDNVPVRGRRSAAQKADEKLKGIMPDVINFQKQMKRGVVVGAWEKAEREQEVAEKTNDKERENKRENKREKVKETAKRRRSDMRYDISKCIFQPTQS